MAFKAFVFMIRWQIDILQSQVYLMRVNLFSVANVLHEVGKYDPGGVVNRYRSIVRPFLHAKSIRSPWLSLSPEVFLARWRTNPFICMACYTSHHLPQDWDCVLPNSWLMSGREVVPTREPAHASYDIEKDTLRVHAIKYVCCKSPVLLLLF